LLQTSNFNQQPFYIIFSQIDVPFELKSSFIRLLSSFHGFASDDPYKNLKKIHVVCSSIKPVKVTEEQIKLKAFGFSLKELIKDWLYYMSSGPMTL